MHDDVGQQPVGRRQSGDDGQIARFEIGDERSDALGDLLRVGGLVAEDGPDRLVVNVHYGADADDHAERGRLLVCPQRLHGRANFRGPDQVED